ncbi:hypothetical protein Bca4012_077410 [Brassica carinata]
MTKKLTGSVMSYFLDFALVPGSETIFESVMFQDCIFTILSYEMTGDLAEILLFCSCTILRHDVLGQETLLNLFLRNYLPYNLYDKAERLRSKAPRFEAHFNQQGVRIGSDTNKTGLRNTSILRNISISYSRISLTDVTQKLRLNSAHPMADA